jgi:hypothetical protein
MECCHEHGDYCPHCTADATAPEPPPASPYHAVTVDGAHVCSGPDLAALAALAAGLPGGTLGDLVIADAGGRVLAVVRDDGSVVKVR